jgi:hypothetical protein
MSANVFPLGERAPQDDGLVVAIAQPFRRFAPGTYEARSMTIRRRSHYKRAYLEAWFQVFDGPATGGRVLGRIPAFFPLPAASRELAPSSNIVRWIQLLGVPSRRDRVPLRTLENKLWRVQVIDVTEDRQGRPLSEPLWYSKIGTILERLA